MALVLYSAQLFLPGGNPAKNTLITVRPRASNQISLLFTTSSGLVPKPNPTITNGAGRTSFWAAPGDYTVRIASNLFAIDVDPSFVSPVWPGLWVHTQAVASAVWTVDHHFGVKPAVDVLLEGQLSEADVTHPTEETTLITFGDPVTGVAYLRR